MNTLKTAFLMTVLTLLMVLVGNALGGQSGMVIAFGMAVIMNFGAYWFSDRMVLRMYRAQEVTEKDAPEIHGMVRELSRRANLPMPRVYIIENDTPNAFATGRNPKHGAVAVTTGILKLLSREELMGVLAHELAHIQNRDILIGSIAATFAGAISMLASMAQWGAILGGGSSDDEEGGGNIFFTIVFSMIASLAATLIQLAISRSREYLADESGARLAGEPRHLASALNKLHHGVERVPMQANPATAHMFMISDSYSSRQTTIKIPEMTKTPKLVKPFKSVTKRSDLDGYGPTGKEVVQIGTHRTFIRDCRRQIGNG